MCVLVSTSAARYTFLIIPCRSCLKSGRFQNRLNSGDGQENVSPVSKCGAAQGTGAIAKGDKGPDKMEGGPLLVNDSKDGACGQKHAKEGGG